MVLFLTGLDYSTAFGATTPTMAIYHGWSLGIHPNIAHPEHLMLEMIRQNFRESATLSRPAQLRRGAELLSHFPEIEAKLAETNRASV